MQMEKMLVNDFYIRQEGNQIYVLCQTYSADQSDRAAAFLSCLTLQRDRGLGTDR